MESLPDETVAGILAHADERTLAVVSFVSRRMFLVAKNVKGEELSRVVCSHFIADGSLELLKWSHEMGFYMNRTACSFVAARNGHLHLLEWLETETDSNWWRRGVIAEAARGGHLNVLEWLNVRDCGADEWTCVSAARGGHIHVLERLKELGCLLTIFCCSAAARGGHLETLKWLRDNGCRWNADTPEEASRGGHLHVLKWLIRNGFKLDGSICFPAASKCHLHVIKWAAKHGYVFDSHLVLASALRNCRTDIIEWMEAGSCGIVPGEENIELACPGI